MRGFFRTMVSLLTVLLLLAAAMLGLFCAMTEASVAYLTSSEALRTRQQERIDQAAAVLTEKWQLSPELLPAWAQDAADRQTQALTSWWHALWHDAAADAQLPPFFSAPQERALVAAVMEDPGFQAAVDPGQHRAVARDEIVYELDEAVCDAVLPLRRSIVGLAVTTAADSLDLPLLRKAALIGAAALAGMAVIMLLMAHRAAGSTLLSAALAMGLVSLPVWALDLRGMLAQLGELAAEQGMNWLLCMSVLWYGAAAVLALTGLLVLGFKRMMRRMNG